VSEPVLLTARAGEDGAVLVVTLNRPRARNAMNPEMRRALDDTFRAAEQDPTVRVVILTGAGPVFCAGMDLKAFAAATRDTGAGDMNAFTWFHRESISKPVIAALNGTAVAGGFEMVLACDLVVASQDAKIGIPEVKRGLYAAGGGTTLSDRIPLAAALELGLTGDLIPVARAAQWGLVNAVVPAPEVLTAAVELAERIAANAPLPVAMTKKLMRERRWGTPQETHSVFASADAKEGATAFAEHRKPVWTGK
jgi:enoyl-CoA hydratase